MQFIDITDSQEERIIISSPGETIIFFYNASKNISVELAAKDAEVKIVGLYVAREDESFELETTQHHSHSGAVSDLLVKGVFDDSSQFTYEGLIRIEKGAHQSAAYQKNQNLVLSKGAVVNSRPFLEILANDVFCTHGATTGRLSEEQIRYLQSRGIEKEQTKKVLSEGFVLDIFNMLEAHGIVTEIEVYKKDALARIYG